MRVSTDTRCRVCQMPKSFTSEKFAEFGAQELLVGDTEMFSTQRVHMLAEDFLWIRKTQKMYKS